jgi:hypothetical protein
MICAVNSPVSTSIDKAMATGSIFLLKCFIVLSIYLIINHKFRFQLGFLSGNYEFAIVEVLFTS